MKQTKSLFAAVQPIRMGDGYGILLKLEVAILTPLMWKGIDLGAVLDKRVSVRIVPRRDGGITNPFPGFYKAVLRMGGYHVAVAAAKKIWQTATAEQRAMLREGTATVHLVMIRKKRRLEDAGLSYRFCL